MKIEYIVIISIVGSLCTLGLSVNAFFLRGIFLDLNAVKVKLAEISVRSESKERRIEELEKNVREIFHRLNKLEKRECQHELCN